SALAPPGGAQQASRDATVTPSAGWHRGVVSSGQWIYRRVRLYAGALTALIIMCVYLAATQPFFFSKANIFDILTSNSDLMLVAIGMTFVVLSAGFDLSVGPMVAASGLAVYAALKSGLPTGVAALVAIGLGLAVGGLGNGMLIGKFKLNFFVVTLGTMSLI